LKISPPFLPLVFAATICGAALLPGNIRPYAQIGGMLFLPLLDRHWTPPSFIHRAPNIISWTLLVLAGAMMLAVRPDLIGFAMASLALAALPEEWFFRSYLMMRLGGDLRANILSSLIFAFAHVLAFGTPAAMVFFPSLLFGWVYWRTRDLVLVVLLHTVANLVNTMFPGWWQLT
jgi:membrane protease YdiL (CAAX protease family)